jgi:hypothetical protein
MNTMTQSPNVETLRTIYADLSKIGDYISETAVLHTANRERPDYPSKIIGKQAIQDHELQLIHLTHGTLLMDVETVVANDYFGSVLGIFRANLPTGNIAAPFCGLWRFQNGLIVEHWENDYDTASLSQRLVNDMPEHPRRVTI